jgi:hypothetical protein
VIPRTPSSKALLLALIVASSFPTSADHLPPSKLARGKDELVLAEVEIFKTSIPTLIRKFGKPTEQRELSPATEGVIGERLYLWKKSNLTLQVGTNLATKPILKGSLSESPNYVIVDGTDGTIGKTGRGLKLGDPCTAIATVYGTRYTKKGRRISIQWESSTTLKIGCNENGLIDHIELLGPE